MSDDKVIRLDDYRPQPPRRYPAEFHTLRGWISALWPSAAFLAFMIAGEYAIGGLAQHILSVAISLAMIAWAIWGILRPGAEEWLEQPELIAIHRRNTRLWSIVSLLLWTLIAGYTVFNLVRWEMAG